MAQQRRAPWPLRIICLSFSGCPCRLWVSRKRNEQFHIHVSLIQIISPCPGGAVGWREGGVCSWCPGRVGQGPSDAGSSLLSRHLCPTQVEVGPWMSRSPSAETDGSTWFFCKPKYTNWSLVEVYLPSVKDAIRGISLLEGGSWDLCFNCKVLLFPWYDSVECSFLFMPKCRCETPLKMWS